MYVYVDTSGVMESGKKSAPMYQEDNKIINKAVGDAGCRMQSWKWEENLFDMLYK